MARGSAYDGFLCVLEGRLGASVPAAILSIVPLLRLLYPALVSVVGTTIFRGTQGAGTSTRGPRVCCMCGSDIFLSHSAQIRGTLSRPGGAHSAGERPTAHRAASDEGLSHCGVNKRVAASASFFYPG